jgi:hypothetical protein
VLCRCADLALLTAQWQDSWVNRRTEDHRASRSGRTLVLQYTVSPLFIFTLHSPPEPEPGSGAVKNCDLCNVRAACSGSGSGGSPAAIKSGPGRASPEPRVSGAAAGAGGGEWARVAGRGSQGGGCGVRWWWRWRWRQCGGGGVGQFTGQQATATGKSLLICGPQAAPPARSSPPPPNPQFPGVLVGPLPVRKSQVCHQMS